MKKIIIHLDLEDLINIKESKLQNTNVNINKDSNEKSAGKTGYIPTRSLLLWMSSLRQYKHNNKKKKFFYVY
tara:strand:+ start:159 stop:374 length:216 start_codon:yes stop_codon:yes gene_type:complete